jgi:hypothetical protein
MVLMAYLSRYDMYVPIFYVLLEDKYESTYHHALMNIVAAMDWKLKASSYCIDFEKGLQKVFKNQFKKIPCIGCLFHWKQALRRKLVQLHVPLDLISSYFDENSHIGMLTVINPDEIEKGIANVRAHSNETGYKKKFDIFWNYFRSTWMKRYDVSSWNINSILDMDDPSSVLVNRTNNPLERFNKTLNQKFQDGQPTMVNFVEIIRKLSNNFVDTLAQQKRKRRRVNPERHQEVTIQKIPDDYYTFEG